MLLRRHRQNASQPPAQPAPKPPTEFDEWTVEQLREYAQQNSINIGNATSAAGITKKIMNAKQG